MQAPTTGATEVARAHEREGEQLKGTAHDEAVVAVVAVDGPQERPECSRFNDCRAVGRLYGRQRASEVGSGIAGRATRGDRLAKHHVGGLHDPVPGLDGA